MKLRIKGNSIRLRLLRSEVERFSADGRISDVLQFGASELRYSLVNSNDADAIRARFDGNDIAVDVPAAIAKDWAEGDAVGIEAEQPLDEGSLSILVEKDFECIDRPDDPDRDDAFPNPQLTCGQTK